MRGKTSIELIKLRGESCEIFIVLEILEIVQIMQMLRSMQAKAD